MAKGSQTASILEQDGARVFALGQRKFEITVDFHRMTSDESCIVPVWDKADFLALGLLSDRQPKFLGQRPNLLLVQVAQWKEGSRQLALPKHVQHVRLVFVPVPGGEESKTRARLVRLDARVVAGGDEGGAQFVGLGQKRAEAHGAVAHDARVGRLAAQIGLDPGIDHR